MVEIKKIDPVKTNLPLIKNAEKAGLTFARRQDTFVLLSNSREVAVGGLLPVNSKRIIFKSLYVEPADRGQGYFKILLMCLFNFSKSLGYEILEANCTEYSIRQFKKIGFLPVKEYKNGIVKVQYKKAGEVEK